MALIYFVRPKKFMTKDGFKKLYYAVLRTVQKRGGRNERDLAYLVSQRGALNEGDALNVLVELPKVIEDLLYHGESVTIAGLGSFHLAVTSEGFEHPEDLTPSQVKLSRIYFVADRGLTYRMKETKFFRYPLSKYIPKHLLSKKLLKEEKEQSDIWPVEESGEE